MLALLLLLACAHRPPDEVGMASWYGPGFRGNDTASGERFRPRKKTAAHPSLPFDTVVVVTRVDTGERVKVRINDRGPYVGGRIIDLSRGAARRLGMIDEGVVEVELRIRRRP